MGKTNLDDGFKRDAVRQIVERGYIGVSQKNSLKGDAWERPVGRQDRRGQQAPPKHS